MQNLTELSPKNLPAGREGADGEELDPKSARKEAINDMKREHIMNAALKVIARDGYASARLEDIAEEAGFSKASIYHYFPDKEALFIHIIIREQRATYDECVKVVARGLPFLDTLREFATVFYDRFFGSGKFYDQYIGGPPSPTILSNFMSNFVVLMTKHEELLKASVICRRETNGLLTQVVANAKKDGVLAIPVEDEFICCLIESFFQTYFMKSLESLHCGNGQDWLLNVNFDKAIDSLFIFFEPWIREEAPQLRREDAQVS